jgi:hypothetical protein
MNSIDLAKKAPRSPYEKIGGYMLLARSIDKCRAYIQGTLGEYMFNCPLDRMLFKFKGITAKDFKDVVEKSRNDDEVLFWLNKVGLQKTDEEIALWSKGLEGKFDGVIADDLASF